jgi:hypothetical protein
MYFGSIWAAINANGLQVVKERTNANLRLGLSQDK